MHSWCAWVRGCFLLLAFALAKGDRTFAARSGPIVVPVAGHDAKYLVTYVYNDKATKPLDPSEVTQDTIVMTKNSGEKFLCHFPAPQSDKTEYNQSSSEGESGTNAPEPRQRTPDELLEPLKTCFYRIEGWWAYEFCFKKHIRQYHQEKDQVVADFRLGNYDAAATEVLNAKVGALIQKDPRSFSGDQRYYAQVYTNGTACDLNDQLRETEVRFLCTEGQTYVADIKEPSTCLYIVTFHTPLICQHPLYRKEQKPWNIIQCEAVGATESIQTEGTPAPSHGTESPEGESFETAYQKIAVADEEQKEDVDLPRTATKQEL